MASSDHKFIRDEECNQDMMDFDDILDELGELGRFQLTTYLLICLPILFAGANSLSYVFTAGIPDYRCFVRGCDTELDNQFHQPWIKYAIPNKDVSNQTFEPAQCEMYARVGDGCGPTAFSADIQRCDEWVFSRENTIVNEWNLTCSENQVKVSFVGNSHFIGILVGSFLFGVLSDRFGRKYLFLVSILIMTLAGVSHLLAKNYYVFLFIACLHAIGTAGVYPLGFVIGVELVGRKKREFTGVVLNFFYAVGEALLGVVAYFCQDWKMTQAIISGPCILFMIYFCYIPESVRWLIAKNKNREASGIIHKAAKINKVVLSQNIQNSLTDPNKSPTNESNEDEEETPMWPMIVDICKTKTLVLRYLIIFLIWCANAFIYYGMSLNSTNMVGNKYINFILVCLIEIPGYLIAWVAILKVGRKYSLIVALFLCAILCATSIFVPKNMDWLIITLFLAGKLCITSSFGIIYVYTAELFPTIVRSGGVATASMFARFGAFLAPFIPLMSQLWQSLPMLLFASIAAGASLLAFQLPETLKRKLPETISDTLETSQ